MKLKASSPTTVLFILISASTVLYGSYFFNYFQTPSGDYIGNFLPQVTEYMNGHFPGRIIKLLPLYPLILALITPLNPVRAEDAIYMSAIIINFILFIPYLVVTYKFFRRFLNEWFSIAAFIYLSVNIYTIFTAVNAELEMLLAILCISGLYASMRDSRLSYIAAFLASLVKWDAVFMIPAVMVRDFFIHKKRISALIIGTAAASGIIIWFFFSVFISSHDNVYVAEIAKRGPNIYRFPIDCILILSGFVQWIGLEGYYSGSLYSAIGRYSAAIIFVLIILINTVWGFIIFLKKHRDAGGPTLVFFGGFLLIHMVYQNSKDRYVLPILAILVLFLFIGISDGLLPRLKKMFSPLSGSALTAVVSSALAFAAVTYIWSTFNLIKNTPPISIFYSFAIIGFVIYAVIKSKAVTNRLMMAFLIVISASVINLQVLYGLHTMDHHSLSRVEFKNVALWFRENYRASDIMLISEMSLPQYYSKLPLNSYIDSYAIKSGDLDELIGECTDKKITYIFVDDYYIRRLKVNDKNAIDRKAALFNEVLLKGPASGHFILVKRFYEKSDKQSYIFRFKP